MRHWHRCERWKSQGLACPFDSIEHEEAPDGGTGPSEDPGIPGPTVDAPIGPGRAVRKKKVQRGRVYEGLLAGAADVPSLEDMVREAERGLPEQPEQGLPFPPPLPPPVVPRPPPAKPAPVPVPQPTAVRAGVPIAAAVPALARARAMVPNAWRPAKLDLRALFPIGAKVKGQAPVTEIPLEVVRAALAERVAADTFGQASHLASGGRFPSKKRIAAATGIAAAAGAGIAAARRFGGGGGGLHVNMARRMRALTAQPGRRLSPRPSQNISGPNRNRTGL